MTTIATNALIVFTKFCAQVLLAQNLGLDRNGQNRFKCGGRFEYSVTVCLKRFTILENQLNRIKAGKNLHNFDSFCYFYTPHLNVFVINEVTQKIILLFYKTTIQIHTRFFVKLLELS